MSEACHERVGGRAALDVVTDAPRLGHVAHDEVRTVALFAHLGRGGSRLLVIVLAVDQRRESIARVALDAFPDIQHRATRGVYEDAADSAQGLEVVNRDAERRQNHHVLRRHRRKVEATIRRQQDGDAHFAQPRVHVRIVNDLANEIDAPVRKLPPRLIRVLHGALHAVAEAEFASEPNRDVPDRERVVFGPHAVHEAPAVVRGKLVLDLGPQAETLSEIGTWVRWRHAES